MVQLSEDCFAFGGKPLPLDEAQTYLKKIALRLTHKHLTREQWRPLADLAGCFTSRELTSKRSVPPFLNAAVDGYAYAHGQDGPLNITQQVPAGSPVPPVLALGEAARVLTGAPLPPGADTVIMDEDAQLAAGALTVPAALRRGSNVRSEGEDLMQGQRLYPAGHLLSPLDLARLAAGGQNGAWVHRPLRILVLSSGDEIRSGQIVDANRWLLNAVFPKPAFRVRFGGVVADSPEASQAALNNREADLVLTSGGVSVGERDQLRDAIETLGMLEFWKVGIKPGRPLAFGRIEDRPIFGLPGNPVACFITAQFLAYPFALTMLGAEAEPKTFPVTQARDYKKKPGRTEFVRVHVDKNGLARPYAVAGAGVISSLTQTDGLVILSQDLTQVAAGTKVPFVPFRGVIA